MGNKNNPNCKHCNSTRVRKYGKYKDVQRYFCNDCGSKFKDDDTTFHMKTDANEVSSALNMYYEGMPIKAIRRHLQQEHEHAPSTATIGEPKTVIVVPTGRNTDQISNTAPTARLPKGRSPSFIHAACPAS